MRTDRNYDPARRVLTGTTATDEQRASATADLASRQLTEAELRDPYANAYAEHWQAEPASRCRMWLVVAEVIGWLVIMCLVAWAAYEAGAGIARFWIENQQLRALAYEMSAM